MNAIAATYIAVMVALIIATVSLVEASHPGWAFAMMLVMFCFKVEGSDHKEAN